MLTPFGVDDNWLIRLTFDNNQEDPLNPKLQVRWLITNNLLFEVESAPRPDHVDDNIIPRIFGALTPSGEKLVTFTCWPGQQTGVINSFELPSGVKSDDIVIENHDGCGNGFSRTPSITPTSNGSGAILQDDYSGNLTYVDLKDGGVIVQQIVDLEDESIWEETPFFGGGAAILDAVIHPDGDLLATATVTGDLSFWSLPELELIGEPIKIGVAGINLNTYMPSAVSPLKFSPDGSLIAHMGIDGSVVLRDTQTLETVTELWIPEIEHPTESPEGGSHLVAGNASLDFAFSRDGSAFAVNSSLSTTLFGCRDWDIDGEPTELQVEIDGPTKLALHEPGTFVATHIGGHHIHGHQFFVNDVAISTMTTGREFTWVPEKAGVFTVTVVIDDGFNLGEVSMEIIVE
jgi:WD40 repeat protein